MEDFLRCTGTPAACNLKVFVTFVPRSDDFSESGGWLPVESQGITQIFTRNSFHEKNVFFHQVPSANCYDIAIITKAGTDKFGRNLLSAGSRLSKLAGKKLRFKPWNDPKEMLLSDLSCCCHVVVSCNGCKSVRPHIVILVQHLEGWLHSSITGEEFSWAHFLALESSFQKLSFWWSSRSFTIFILFKQLGVFLKQSVCFPEALGKWGSTVQQHWDLYSSTQSACVVYSWVSCSKRDNWRCKACAFDWVRRLISRVLEWTTCLRCGTGKCGIFTESEFHVAIWKDGKPFLLKCLY